jgi:hypothetical protein
MCRESVGNKKLVIPFKVQNICCYCSCDKNASVFKPPKICLKFTRYMSNEKQNFSLSNNKMCVLTKLRNILKDEIRTATFLTLTYILQDK